VGAEVHPAFSDRSRDAVNGEHGDPVVEGVGDLPRCVFRQEVQAGTVTSRWWGQVRHSSRSGPVSSAPGSPLRNSFGTGEVAIHCALAVTMPWTSAGWPSIGISCGQVSVGRRDSPGTPPQSCPTMTTSLSTPIVVSNASRYSRRSTKR
jgi:hypothetical protein